MTDIRKACKIFLDFVYESDLIPEKIVKILNQPLANGEKCSGDFRKILSIIAYNNQYGNGRYEYNDFEKQIVDKRDDFNLIGEDRLKWLSLNRPTLLTTQKYCNEFFHNEHFLYRLTAFWGLTLGRYSYIVFFQPDFQFLTNTDQPNRNRFFCQTDLPRNFMVAVHKPIPPQKDHPVFHRQTVQELPDNGSQFFCVKLIVECTGRRQTPFQFM